MSTSRADFSDGIVVPISPTMRPAEREPPRREADRMTYQPSCIVVLDDERESVGSTALALVRLGVEPLYSKWLDEAQLFACEASGRVDGGIASSRLSTDQLVALRDVVAANASERKTSVLLVGPQTDPTSSEELRRAGFSSCLWEPFNTAELRFAISNLVLIPEEVAPRREPRAGANCLCWMLVDGTRSFGVLYTISARGAYVEMPSPLPEGTEIEMEFDFDDLKVATTARVIYSIRPDHGRISLLAPGVGCVFTGLEKVLESEIRSRVARRAARHSLPNRDVPDPLETTRVSSANPLLEDVAPALGPLRPGSATGAKSGDWLKSTG